MSIGLYNLTSARGSRRGSKRVGRGTSSGHGTYSTRGQKGQRARSGGKNRLKQKGMRALLLSIPKKRGFQSRYAKPAVVNVADLEKNFEDGALVSVAALQAKKLLPSLDKIRGGVKILSDGELTKKLEVVGCLTSAKAKEKILKAGGTVV